MATGTQVAVDEDPAVLLAEGDNIGTHDVVLYIVGDPVAIGGDATVVYAEGFVLDASATPMTVRLGPGDKLYGICTTAESAVVHVLSTRPDER